MKNNRVSILIVDDQPHVRKGLQAFLETNEKISIVGFASNGIQAIDLAVSQKPDVILMDAQMPYLDGFEASQFIQEALSSVQIILMDTKGDAYFQKRVQTAGARAFILKNKPAMKLMEIIEEISQEKTSKKSGRET